MHNPDLTNTGRLRLLQYVLWRTNSASLVRNSGGPVTVKLRGLATDGSEFEVKMTVQQDEAMAIADDPQYSEDTATLVDDIFSEVLSTMLEITPPACPSKEVSVFSL